MPRIRTIKPEFFASEAIARLPLRARLTFVGLWTHCDDQGRCRDNVKLIKAAVWPLDEVSLKDLEADLKVLTQQGRIIRYKAAARPTGDGGPSDDAPTMEKVALIQIVNWDEHQKINRPSKTRFPGPDNAVRAHGALTEGSLPVDNSIVDEIPGQGTHEQFTEDSVSPHGGLTPGKERKGTGKEGGGAGARADDQPPPLRCPKHRDDEQPPPCGACADARRARETWQARQAEASNRDRLSELERQAQARALAIADCDLCDDNGYAGRVLCDHDPDAADRAARGRAKWQAALNGRGPT